jgi:hypothetical protein
MKKAQPWIGLLVRLGLGGVLLYAGYLKAFTPDKSMMAVRAYELLPIWLANAFGIILPWLEMGAGYYSLLALQLDMQPSLVLVSWLPLSSQSPKHGLVAYLSIAVVLAMAALLIRVRQSIWSQSCAT